jgi:hypothetical protein
MKVQSLRIKSKSGSFHMINGEIKLMNYGFLILLKNATNYH